MFFSDYEKEKRIKVKDSPLFAALRGFTVVFL
jgi:hypothetical protein